ncbi:cytosolic sulfotransferase 6-like [Apium graveolens]|uniref:cytosolic sulfotransferase 6-like n=1 Tax=Apium graveolens TaxID=4045 RepID=UPI003D7AED5F
MEPAETKSQPPDEQVDLLSSLPSVRVQESYLLYQYQGFWYPPHFVQGIINCQQQFQPRENDIFLVTAPKSGTTWFRALLFALMNRKTHPPQSPHHPLLHKTPSGLLPLLEMVHPSEYDSAACNSLDSNNTRIFSTHMPLATLPKSITDNSSTSSNCKIVYLCRGIKDNFVSFFHFINNNNYLHSPISLEDAFELYCNGKFVIGPVWDQILGYWKESLESPHKVLFMKYEDMKIEPRIQLTRLARFLGNPFSPEEQNSGLIDQILSLCSFDNLSKLKVNNIQEPGVPVTSKSFFRNGVVGDAKNYLSADMVSRLDQITQEKFRDYNLSL